MNTYEEIEEIKLETDRICTAINTAMTSEGIKIDDVRFQGMICGMIRFIGFLLKDLENLTIEQTNEFISGWTKDFIKQHQKFSNYYSEVDIH